MIANEPPQFLLFVNNPGYCADNYLNYLKKALRSAFDFTGLPIVMTLRARPKKVASFHTESRSQKKKPGSKSSTAKSPRKSRNKSGGKSIQNRNSQKNKRNNTGKSPRKPGRSGKR
jgi:GTP-binding protein